MVRYNFLRNHGYDGRYFAPMNAPGAGPMAHVLVVDDDREIRDLLAGFLTKHGYRVTALQDGKNIRRALAECHIDLVVFDLMLP